MTDSFHTWLAALEARHLADLRIPEVTRALRALSSAYVERRRTPSPDGSHQSVHGALDTAGKRAAFALFYGPLHFIAVTRVVEALGAGTPPPDSILDVGCGTGVAGAAWALAAAGGPTVTAIDRHPWAVDEARWTCRQLGVSAHARRGDVTRLPARPPGSGIVAAYTMNELPQATRLRFEDTLLADASQGVRILVIEPIARSITPWWSDTSRRVTAAGGRADEWRFDVDLPPLVRLFDKAAGLKHREITLRSLYHPGAVRPA